VDVDGEYDTDNCLGLARGMGFALMDGGPDVAFILDMAAMAGKYKKLTISIANHGFFLDLKIGFAERDLAEFFKMSFAKFCGSSYIRIHLQHYLSDCI
jgi:hypothetical protein